MICLRQAVFSLSVASTMALMTATAFAGPEGRYAVSGVNPGGSGTYRGTVNVTSMGEAYEVTWRIGGTRYTGIGVTKQLRGLVKSLAEWRRKVPTCVELPKRLDRNRLLALSRACAKKRSPSRILTRRSTP